MPLSTKSLTSSRPQTRSDEARRLPRVKAKRAKTCAIVKIFPLQLHEIKSKLFVSVVASYKRFINLSDIETCRPLKEKESSRSSMTMSHRLGKHAGQSHRASQKKQVKPRELACWIFTSRP